MKPSGNKYPWVLLLILAIGSGLRLFNLGELSLSNDELSALNRLNYSSLEAVIEQGVVKHDFHPAGIQVFLYYWTSLVGTEGLILRLPFALCSIASIFMIFLLGRDWFSEKTGLFAAGLLAVLAYPLLYGQLARPYAPGLLFCLSCAYFWGKFLFDKKNPRWALVGYILSTALCMYTHYYAFFTAGIIGLSGLFFLNKRTAIPYLLSGIIALLLYLPHLSIFLSQLGKGGLGGEAGWLGAPKGDWIWEFLSRAFNNSWILGLALTLTLVFLNFNRKNPLPQPFTRICLYWFLLSFGFGYLYSTWVSPILQHSILLFSFPFLLLALGSLLFSEREKKGGMLFAGALILISLASTLIEVNYYSKFYFGNFKELGNKWEKWTHKYGEENILALSNVNDPSYLAHYLDKSPAIMVDELDSQDSIPKLRSIIGKSDKAFVLFAWSDKEMPLEIFDIIREEYPGQRAGSNMFNSGIYLFEKGKKDERKSRLISQVNFETENYDRWEAKGKTYLLDPGHRVNVLSADSPFSYTFTEDLNTLVGESSQIIRVECLFKFKGDPRADLIAVIERNGKVVKYHSSRLNLFEQGNKDWSKAYLTRVLPAEMDGNEKLKIYLWQNNKKGEVLIDKLKISTSPLLLDLPR